MSAETIEQATSRYTAPVHLAVEKFFNFLGWMLLAAALNSAARLTGDVSIIVVALVADLALLAYVIASVLKLTPLVVHRFKPGRSQLVTWGIVAAGVAVLGGGTWLLTTAMSAALEAFIQHYAHL